MKALATTAFSIALLAASAVNAAQPLSDKQMDQVTAGTTTWSVTGPFTITGFSQTDNFVSLMGTCTGSCSNITSSSSFAP